MANDDGAPPPDPPSPCEAWRESMLAIEPELAQLDAAGQALMAVAALARGPDDGTTLHQVERNHLAALVQLVADQVTSRVQRADQALRPAFARS